MESMLESLIKGARKHVADIFLGSDLLFRECI